LRPSLKRVPLETHEEIAASGDRFATICFPEGSIVSVADILNDGRRLGLGLVGCEGMLGWPILLGVERSIYQVVVQGEPDTALRIEIADLLQACDESPTLRMHLLRFVHYFTTQMGRTIVSNLVDPLERRLARWLLMNHDRSVCDELLLTHDELGAMLGVRRASVTDCLHVLEGEQAIRGQRGRILIRNRKCLERIAGEAYGFAEAQYRAAIGPFGKSAADCTG